MSDICPTFMVMKTERVTIRLSPSERERIKSIAEAEGNTPSGIMRRLINLGLDVFEERALRAEHE